MIKQNSFEELREDGNTISEMMPVADILAKDWKAKKVVAIKWSNDEKTIQLMFDQGVLAKVLEDRSAIVAIAEKEVANSLLIIDEFGNQKHAISTVQNIENEFTDGTFEWFEASKSQHSFSVIYKKKATGDLYKLEIDPNSGQTLNAIRYQ